MYFHLFANVILTKGFSRSLVSDIFFEKTFLIPNSLYDFIGYSNGKSKVQIINLFDKKDKNIIIEYFKWLETNHLITWFESKKTGMLFSEINNTWDTPYKISNIIIDVSNMMHRWSKIFRELTILRVPMMQLRFFKKISYDSLLKILSYSLNSKLKSIEIILPSECNFDLNQIELLITTNKRVCSLIFYNSKFVSSKRYKDIFEKYGTRVLHISENITSHFHCGMISEKYFNSSQDFYLEGISHNTCLNRKISIDINGEIKNCPSMSKSYGNIRITTLMEVIGNKQFEELWHISKDQVRVCKICEFRNVCSDCRAYLQNPDDIYSKPLKCGYDPYTNKWEEWSTNPLSKKAIEYYGMENLVKKS